MIVEKLIEIFLGIISGLFSWIHIPDLPSQVETIINQLFQYMADGVGIVSLIIDLQLALLLLPIVIALNNLEYLYRFTMWVIRKLPFGMS